MQKGTVGGVLTIVSSVLGALGSIFFLAMPYLMSTLDDFSGTYDTEAIDFVGGLYAAIGIIGLLLGALGIVGGIFAVNRKTWGLALAGAIASSILFFPLGIVAVIFVSMAQPEFAKPAASAAINQPPGP